MRPWKIHNLPSAFYIRFRLLLTFFTCRLNYSKHPILSSIKLTYLTGLNRSHVFVGTAEAPKYKRSLAREEFKLYEALISLIRTVNFAEKIILEALKNFEGNVQTS